MRSDPEMVLLLLRAEYNKQSSLRGAFQPLKIKSFYEQGDRAGKLLAWQIRRLETKLTITSIITNDGTLVDPQEINDAFKDYYEKLYNAQGNVNINDLYTFLNRLNIPAISNNDRIYLGLEINKEEIGYASDGIKSGKRAGLDGLPIDLYKNVRINYSHLFQICSLRFLKQKIFHLP